VQIKFLHRSQIDIVKWDNVIAHSPVETLYPYSWYLDAVAEHWSALVMEDYRFIMPLVWKRKMGISYLYQPFHTQQLGVFSREYVDPPVIAGMLSKLPRRFLAATIHFNTGNLVGEKRRYDVSDLTNYVLELDQSYEELSGSFSNNAKRNIRKAYELNDHMEKVLDPNELVGFKRDNDQISRSEAQYNMLARLLKAIGEHGEAEVYVSRDRNGILEAAAFFGFSKTRAIYLVSASTESGKENRCMFKLVDAFIREHAGSGLILDFEGSNLPSVARFFSGFGARPETYQGVSFNKFYRVLKIIGKHV
jgi:hypothetical protein